MAGITEQGILIGEMVKVCEEADRVVLELPEKIDAVNSSKVAQEIDIVFELYKDKNVCLDASKTIYISWPSLRLFLNLRKKYKERLSVSNVSPDVYDNLTVTGLNARKKAREISIDGCPVIGKGAFGTVYRLDDETVVKVYKNGEDSLPVIEHEQKIARQAFIDGIPTAIPFDIVKVGDQYGVVFELLDAKNCMDMVIEDPSVLKTLIPKYAAFLRNLHKIEIDDNQIPSTKDINLKFLDSLAPVLGKETEAKLRALYEKMPEERHVIHGDAHLKNIMISGDEMRVIDMDNMCKADPVFEFAGLYTTYVAFNEDDPDDAMRFQGAPVQTCRQIFYETLKEYLKGRNVNPDTVLPKIQLIGYLRLLTEVVVKLKRQSEFETRRVARISGVVSELASKVENLCMFS